MCTHTKNLTLFKSTQKLFVSGLDKDRNICVYIISTVELFLRLLGLMTKKCTTRDLDSGVINKSEVGNFGYCTTYLERLINDSFVYIKCCC